MALPLHSNDNIDSIVRQVSAIFRQHGGARAIEALFEFHAHDKELPLPDVMYRIAASFSATHPADSLAILNQVLQIDEAHLPSLIRAATLNDRLGNKKEALLCCESVLNNKKSSDREIIIAANLLVRLEDKPRAYTAAVAAFNRAEKPLSLAAGLLYIAQRCADFALVDQLTSQLLTAYKLGKYSETLESPRQNVLWCGELSTNIRVTEAWSRRDLPKPVATPAEKHSPLKGRRIRIGYLSSDFREHPTSRLANGLFRNHDRTRFELFMYCSGWDDGSMMRREVESHFDHVHSVSSLSDADAAKLIRQHQIDVLIELNGPTRSHRMGILSYRPCPVQIDYLGWPGSVGGRVVDYVIGDEYTVPEGAERLYPEKVIRLSATYQINDHLHSTLPPTPSRSELQLPENALVIGMFNAINKVNAEAWAAWMAILRNVPDSVLWVLNPGEVARRQLAKATKSAGIALKRVIAAPMASHPQHLARLAACDLIVDPWPYGGHTSTSDALFAGVPVVAMLGSNFAGRVSGGLLRAAGLEVMVRKDVQDYVRFTTTLLRDPGELARLKQWVREKTPQTALFDAVTRTRELERAYETALHRAMAGQPPIHMSYRPPVRAFSKKDPSQVAIVSTVNSLDISASEDVSRPPLVLVCGPWSSGTSAIAGLLVKAGLQAPGPYVKVNDTKTPETFEMQAFQRVLRELASELTLQRTTDGVTAFERLRAFRDDTLLPALGAQTSAPIMLKHALAILFLPELCKLFNLRIVGVLRSLDTIEATRKRRGWTANFGRKGASSLYQVLFDHVINTRTPFMFVRYEDLRSNLDKNLGEIASFCSLSKDSAMVTEAAAFFRKE